MKKRKQLGMSSSTASNRLVKDILFSFVREHSPNCYRCGKEMTRETFSIEHKTPWLDSNNPKELFFCLDNISYSHLSCNVRASRREKNSCGTNSSYARGCRCDMCKDAHAKVARESYCKESRRDRYNKTGH